MRGKGVTTQAATPDNISGEPRDFVTDRLQRRSMKRHLRSSKHVFLVAEDEAGLLGYVLVFIHRGTSLARLYSLAVNPRAQGRGVARALLTAAEERAAERGRAYMRLEVRADNNRAIRLYELMGYTRFGLYEDYYEDHAPALRYQKQIICYDDSGLAEHAVRYYGQQTDFTCGPAALMMAFSALQPDYLPNLEDELDIWREATTIFMTSGHGGCHPLGLALAAVRRGFHAEVWLNQDGPLFVDGVRTEHKKAILSVVHEQFRRRCHEQGIPVCVGFPGTAAIREALAGGRIPLVLISTYRFDRKKVPHWVAVVAADEHCVYLHDPDIKDEDTQDELDHQYMPMTWVAFERAATFGRSRLRAMVMVGSPQKS